jgi:rhodanese-related sulfurtransferase
MKYLFDVRDDKEYQEGHVAGALHVPLLALLYGNFEVIAHIPKDASIFLYCHSGGRAERAKELLLAQGFSRVVNVGGKEEAEAWMENEGKMEE